MVKKRIFIPLAQIACLLLLMGQAVTSMAAFNIEVTDRHLYGPGPFPDQTLKTAWIRNIKFDDFLNGKVDAVNNLGEEPNVSGEVLQGKIIDGMLSDKTLINEDIDMSNAVIMNGQFNLLLAAVYGGTNEGHTFFYRDGDFNWWIKDDIAIDPGFPAGIVKMDNFTFTTGPRIIPTSMQAEAGYPGGTNQTGSLEAGRVAFGRLGDNDADGYIDGIFNAIGRFPMESIFLPGAPFVQLFEFKSDIPIGAQDAALLSIASARSHLNLLDELAQSDSDHVDIPKLEQNVSDGIKNAVILLKKAHQNQEKNGCLDCTRINDLITSLDKASADASRELIRPIVQRVFDEMVKLHKSDNDNSNHKGEGNV